MPVSNRFDKYESARFGRIGTEIITDTAVHTGPYAGFTVTAAAVFTTLTGPAHTGSFGAATIAAGTTIYGWFTTITLASGAVLAYKGE